MENKEKFNYWKLFGPGLVFFIALTYMVSATDSKSPISYDPAPTIHYFKTGSSAVNPDIRMQATKVVHVTGVVPTTGNGGTLDVSWLASIGITTVTDVYPSVQRNSSVATDMLDVTVKTVSSTAITYNITQGQTALISVLGASVSTKVFPSTTSDIKLNFLIIGY